MCINLRNTFWKKWGGHVALVETSVSCPSRSSWGACRAILSKKCDTARHDFSVPKWMGWIACRVITWCNKWNLGYSQYCLLLGLCHLWCVSGIHMNIIIVLVWGSLFSEHMINDTLIIYHHNPVWKISDNDNGNAWLGLFKIGFMLGLWLGASLMLFFLFVSFDYSLNHW